MYSYVYFVSSKLCTLEWTFNYLFIIPNTGGGVENFFGGVDILFGGGVSTPQKIRLWCNPFCIGVIASIYKFSRFPIVSVFPIRIINCDFYSESESDINEGGKGYFREP